MLYEVITFRETSLVRTWQGQWGFRDFLRDFRDGKEIYEPKDFPKQQTILEGLGVKRIQVNYKVGGADPVLAIADYPPLKVPSRVAFCWAGLGGTPPPVGGPATSTSSTTSATPAMPAATAAPAAPATTAAPATAQGGAQ